MNKTIGQVWDLLIDYDIATPEEQTIDLPLIESNGNIRNVSLGCNTAASSISFSITK